MSGDGYYYREVGQAVAAGPHTWGEFQKLRAAGKISVRSKAWKQGGGQIFAVRGFITCALSYPNYFSLFQVDIKRKFTLAGLCSFSACNHCFELCMISMTFSMTAFSLTLLDWQVNRALNNLTHTRALPTLPQDSKDKGAKYLLASLSVVTLLLVIAVSFFPYTG